MPELLKNLYNRDLVNKLSNTLKQAWNPFDELRFIEFIFDEHWNEKELKQRMRHITVGLYYLLPKHYLEALEILKQTAPHFNGFPYMFFPDYVEVYGHDYEDESMKALELFTQFSSSEFAIRPFIKRDSVKTMLQMLKWCVHPNQHLRRLASEGCRPRLP